MTAGADVKTFREFVDTLIEDEENTDSGRQSTAIRISESNTILSPECIDTRRVRFDGCAGKEARARRPMKEGPSVSMYVALE